MSFIDQEALNASRALGLRRGAFPLIEHSIYKDNPVRHAARTTVAPTGTISIIAGCSGGIEPAFALAFKRSHYLDDDPNKRHEMIEVNPVFQQWLATREDGPAILSSYLENGKDNRIPSYFATSHDITPEWHVKMQAAFQKYVDNSVSKTINLPNNATVEDVANAYMLAWDTECKGVTIYRDGSKDLQVLSKIKTETKEETTREEVSILHQTRNGIHHRFTVAGNVYYVGVGMYENGKPAEVFIIGSKVGSSTRGYLDTIGILMSKALQRGEEVHDIATSLVGQRFEPSGFTGNGDIPIASSVVDYVARWLKLQFLPDEKSGKTGSDIENSIEVSKDKKKGYSFLSGEICPECDGLLVNTEGCNVCYDCGYSKC